MNDRAPMSIGDLGVNGGSHLQFKLAYVCVCVCLHAEVSNHSKWNHS